MKSVMRSSMLRGSRTKVGKVTLDRSMPTLPIQTAHQPGRANTKKASTAHRSCEISEAMIEPSFSSLCADVSWVIAAADREKG